ncbi:MAG TPA: hypothetical protein VNX21_03505 [Candidatus Thermoplasmatota archaeon]|nr:hypothetical protein [Candidatus Thermoplasmatota archaeon]
MNTIGISALAVLLLAAPALADPLTVPLSATGAANDLYVGEDGTLWEETNGLADLQREATETEDGRVIPADTQISA